MHITSTGVLLIPLTLLVFFLAPTRIGQWAILVSALAAASVFNIGGGFPVGVTPYFFAAALIGLRVGPSVLTGRVGFWSEEPIRNHVRMLWLFVAWGVAAAFLLPVLFHGVPVDLARAGVDQTYFYQIPLHWSFSNAGQAGYLLLDFGVVLLFLQNASRPGYVEDLVRAFTWCGLLVVAVGAYQLVAYRFGLPFPSGFLYSNNAWGQLAGEGIAGWSRINSTFTEASAAGGFLAMWSTFELILAARSGREGSKHWWFALAGSFMVVNTTSTTGYVALAIAWGAFTWRYLVRTLWQGRVPVRALFVTAFSFAAVAVAFLTGGHIASLLNTVLLNKLHSGSAEHRLASAYRSIGIFTQSFGIGVGLGSDRALSVGAYILANLGVVGIVLFPYLVWQLYVMGWNTIRTRFYDWRGRVWFEALGWAFAVQLLAMLESGAEITGPTLWIPWAILAAIIRRNWLVARQSLSDG